MIACCKASRMFRISVMLSYLLILKFCFSAAERAYMKEVQIGENNVSLQILDTAGNVSGCVYPCYGALEKWD